jgi:hypothetical protein
MASRTRWDFQRYAVFGGASVQGGLERFSQALNCPWPLRQRNGIRRHAAFVGSDDHESGTECAGDTNEVQLSY